jgi:amino acid transporter
MRDALRWLAVPIAAYLVITLGLPAAHGAAGNARFTTHAMGVGLGCAIIIAIVAAITVVANRRDHSRVPGGPS